MPALWDGYEFLDDDLRDQVVQYALGSLPEPAARAHRLHLARCAVCAAEAASLAELTREMVLLAPSKAPPPELWDRVLKRIRPSSAPCAEGVPIQVWKDWAPLAPAADDSGMTYVPGSGEAFEPTGAPGVDVRRLFVDHEARRVTLLVRELEPTLKFMRDVLGFSVVHETPARVRMAIGGTQAGHLVDVTPDASMPSGVNGVGAIHHVAFAIATGEEQTAFRADLAAMGFDG